MSKIKDIIEKNEREFEELVAEKRGILARAGHILIPILFTETEVKSHLHQSQSRLLEGVAENIGEKYASKVKKLFNGYGGKLGFTQNELLDLPLSSPPKTNNKEI